MSVPEYAWVAAAVLVVYAGLRLRTRIRLSRAKQPKLAGHFRLARRLAGLVPAYEFDDDCAFAADGATPDIAARRRAAFGELAARLAAKAPRTLAAGDGIDERIPDVDLISTYRVPFQFRRIVRGHMRIGGFVDRSEGTELIDLDGNRLRDVGGSYGVNVFGYDFYKSCMDRATESARQLGPVLGPYHPAIVEVVDRLAAISGLDAISFHMSGTEAVMQAVRVARFHTRRTHVVTFCGAYHGWWDGVQPNVANERALDDLYMLREMSSATLDVIRSRSDIACVLVNPIQAMHPNSGAPGDGMLVDSSRSAAVDREAYSHWLAALREACDRNGVVLIFDEVFVGFRLARGGAQEYFGTRADIVTYGKTLGGGLPIGVVCGRPELMRRYRSERPMQICLARGTFNSHPYVVCAMREFLRRLDEPAIRESYVDIDRTWDDRARALNDVLSREGLPVRVANLVSVFTVVYLEPSRYNWMMQFYLRDESVAMSWVGTGRLIFSHNYTDADFADFTRRFVAAARRMQKDSWWWQPDGLTNARIRSQVLREILRARFGLSRRKPLQAGDHPGADQAGSRADAG